MHKHQMRASLIKESVGILIDASSSRVDFRDKKKLLDSFFSSPSFFRFSCRQACLISREKKGHLVALSEKKKKKKATRAIVEPSVKERGMK